MIRGTVLMILLFFTCKLQAQICNGSLGDPLINITFGAGTNPGPSLSAATTNYQYVSNDCPNDGAYTLRNSSNACFGSTWHTITDHTGNPNGYFMLVNASIQPSAFYVDTVKGLCGNTTYEFAAWILNILKASSCGGAGTRPNLTFSMEKTDGTVLTSYNTNDIPSTNTPEWKQYGFFFKTPVATTDVVLRITNNANGGCGNDLALDDITFRPCGPQITTSISGSSSTTATMCEGTSSTYTFNGNVSTGFNNPVVQWQQSYNGGTWTDIPGAITTSYTRSFSSTTPAGNYSFRLTAAEAGNMASAQCRIASTPLIVTVIEGPVTTITNNSPVCEGGAIMLSTPASNATVTTWSGPNGFSSGASEVIINNAQQSNAGKYYLAATKGNCTKMDSVVVVVNANPVIALNQTTVSLCEGDTATVSVTGANNYLWSPATGISSSTASTILVYPSDSVQYTVIGKNAAGCTDTAELIVNVLTKPTANAGPDKFIIEGNTAQLFGAVSGDNISYQWLPVYAIDNAQSLTPVVSPEVDTSYILKVTSLDGCGVDSDTARIHVYKKIIIPNAFSPNGDGINEKWTITGLESYPGATVFIYNRYGQIVFRSSRFTGWDGKMQSKLLPVGVYYYMVQLNNGFPPLAGYITLVL